MRFLDNLRIGIKLPLVIMGIAIVMLALAELIAVRLIKDAILEAERGRLVAVAGARAAALDRGFREILADLEQSAESPVTLGALRAFTQGWDRLGSEAPDTLRSFYVEGEPGRHEAAERLSYPLVHGRYHPEFASLAAARGYGDIFLVDARGYVVYSVGKGSEFARSLSEVARQAPGLASAIGRALGPVSQVDGGPGTAIRRDGAGLVVARAIRSPFGTLQGAIAYRIPDLLLAELGAGSGRRQMAERTAIVTPDGVIAGTRTRGEGQPPDWLFARVDVSLGDDLYGVIAGRDMKTILAPAREARIRLVLDSAVALFGVLALSLFVARRISIPLAGVGSAIEATAGGNYDIAIPWTCRNDEIGAIARALDRFRAALIEAEGAARERDFKGAAFGGTSAALLLVDRALTILYVNPALERLISVHAGSLARVGRNLAATELVGRNLAHLFPGAALLAADLMNGEADAVGQEIAYGASVLRFDLRLVRGRGREPLGYVIEVQDRTERRADQAILTALHRTHAVAEFSPDARLIRANRAFRRLMHLGADAGTGLVWDRVLDWSGDAFDPWRTLGSGTSVDGTIAAPGTPASGRVPATATPVIGEDGRLVRVVLLAACPPEQAPPDLGASMPSERIGPVPC